MKKVGLLAGLSAFLAVLLMWWGFLLPPAAPVGPPAPRALLLVEDDTGTYPMQLRKGLQEALEQQGGSLRGECLGDVDPSDPALYATVDTLYLLASDPAAVLALLPENGPRAVIIGAEAPGRISVLPDLEDGGWQAGLDIALTRPEKPVLIVGDRLSPKDALRLRGALRGLGTYPTEVVTPEEALLKDPGRYSTALALSGEATALLARWEKRAAAPRLPLYGFDAPDERVALLENGLLQGVVADNPYAVGYLAGSAAVAGAAAVSPALHLAPVRLVTPKTLYDAQNVKLMFPLLQ